MASTKYHVLMDQVLLKNDLYNSLRDTCELIPFSDSIKYSAEYSDKIDAIVGVVGLPLVTQHMRDERFVGEMPNFKVIFSMGAGTDHLNLPLLSAKGIRVATVGKINSESTAELGFALMMASARSLKEAMAAATSPGGFKSFRTSSSVGIRLFGATLGIVGMGSIGYLVAERAAAFKMNILYHTRKRRSEEEEEKVQANYCASIDKLLLQSDFVMMCVPLTEDTKHMIGAKELKLMKPNAVLINISRGGVVDQSALVTALQNGTIGGAALDVTTPEPLPLGHPLLHMPNVIITPHYAGGTLETYKEGHTRAVANLLPGLKGLPMPNEFKFSHSCF